MTRLGALTVKRAAPVIALACLFGTASAQAAYLDARGAIQPLVGSSFLPTAQSYFPRNDLDGATSTDSVVLPFQNYPWSGGDENGSGAISSSITARAGFGSLGAYAQTSASVQNAGYARGGAQATAYFRDTFTVHAPREYNGQATVNFQLNAHGISSVTGSGQATFFATLAVNDTVFGGYPVELHANSYEGETVIKSQSATLWVGIEYIIYGELQANANAEISGSAEMSALNTSHNYFWSDDPNVTFTTVSGASYAVPEPAGLASLGIALCVGAMRRKKAM